MTLFGEINGFAEPRFWGLVILGWLGIFVWILKSALDKKDERFTLASCLSLHSICTFLLSVVSHFILCIAFHQMGQLNEVATIGAGFMGQSVIFSFLGSKMLKIDPDLKGGDK